MQQHDPPPRCHAITRRGQLCRNRATGQGDRCRAHAQAQAQSSSLFDQLPNDVLLSPAFASHLDFSDRLKLACTSKATALLFEPLLRETLDPWRQLVAVLQRDMAVLQRLVSYARNDIAVASANPYVSIKIHPPYAPHMSVSMVYHARRNPDAVLITLYDDVRREFTRLASLAELKESMFQLPSRELRTLAQLRPWRRHGHAPIELFYTARLPKACLAWMTALTYPASYGRVHHALSAMPSSMFSNSWM